MRKFFLWLSLAAFSIGALILSAGEKDVFPVPSFFALTLLLLFAVTGLSFSLLYKAAKPPGFLQSYLLSTTFKLLGYGAYNLIIIFSDREGATANVLFFMFTYLVFTVVEIGFLYLKFLPPGRR